MLFAGISPARTHQRHGGGSFRQDRSRSLPDGKKTLVKGLKGKKGSIPEKVRVAYKRKKC